MTDKSGLPDGQEFFKLNEVCKLANLQPYMLRFWGSEFTELEASRSDTGQRLYTRDQVEVILEIRRLLFDEGLTIAGTRKRINALREGAKAAGGKRSTKTTAADDAAPVPAAALAGESELAAAVLDDDGAPPSAAHDTEPAAEVLAAEPSPASITTVAPLPLAMPAPAAVQLVLPVDESVSAKEVDKKDPDRVQPLLAALREVRSEVSRIVAEIRQTVGERP